MSELTVRDGNNLPSKAVLGSYVHDAAEMEFDLLTLEKSRDELREKIQKERSRNIRREKGNFILQPHLHKKPTHLEVKENTAALKLPDKWGKDMIGSILGICALISFGLAVVIGVIVGVIFEDAEIFQSRFFADNGLVFRLFLIFFPIVLLIAIIVVVVKNTSVENKRSEILAAHHREIEMKNEKIRRENVAAERYNVGVLPGLNAQIDEENRKGEELHEQMVLAAIAEHESLLSMLDAQYRELDTAIAKAKTQRDKFYSVNIVPIDYRTIDCTFVLDQIFRNDLADTMREAIAKYEERVYRGEVVKGIAAIASNLNNLTGLMLDLSNRINSIQTQVSMMSNDLYSMADRQARMQSEMDDNNRRVLEESRLNRYATESLNRNAEKIVRYCETGSTY